MKELLRIRGKGRARWRDFDGGHNDTCIKEGYWDAIREWLNEEVLGQGEVDVTEKAVALDEEERIKETIVDEEGLDQSKVSDGGWEKVEMNFEVESKKDL